MAPLVSSRRRSDHLWSTRTLRVVLAACGVLLSTAAIGWADPVFVQTNLVSSVPGLAAFTDPFLKNPWGIATSAASPFWIANQATSTSTIYNSTGVKQALQVAVPGTSGAGPTGTVFNNTGTFQLNNAVNATFLFAGLDGTISGWNGAAGTTAIVAAAATDGAVYTGLAIGKTGAASRLYAADAANNKIDVYDPAFQKLSTSFVDPSLPAGFTVYNIQNLDGTLYVTYENETTGGGVVNAFDLDGNFLRRVSSNAAGGPLDGPWGLAFAPVGFGVFGGALLVGNEEDGHISAFNALTGQFLGQLLDASAQPIANLGLWGLKFGNGGNGGDPNLLYFAAGINNEQEGLFGSIAASPAVPEPMTSLLIGTGFAGLAARRYRRRRS